jgi:hypothetical protein
MLEVEPRPSWPLPFDYATYMKKKSHEKNIVGLIYGKKKIVKKVENETVAWFIKIFV